MITDKYIEEAFDKQWYGCAEWVASRYLEKDSFIAGAKWAEEKISKDNERLQKLLDEAVECLEDYDLEDSHVDGCRFLNFGISQACKCMDRRYYNKESNLKRAREFLAKYKGIK